MTIDVPTLTLDWLPDEGPNADAGDWDDISQYFAGGKTTRGRNYELDRFETGTISITLRSSTRLFDPDYAAGTYYGKLKPMRQIRLRATWDGTTYDVFRGYVTSWGNTIGAADNMVETTITAKDGFARLEQIALPSSAWALEILQDDPSAWFRLGESDTVRITDSSPTGNFGVYDNCQQGQQGLVVNDDDGAVSFAHSLEERAVIQNPNLITGYPFTVSMMCQVDGSDPGGAKYLLTAMTKFVSGNTNGLFIGLGYTGSTVPIGAVYALAQSSSGNSFATRGSQRIDDGRPHHLAIVFNSTTSFDIYIDGVLDSGATTGTSGTPAFPGSPPNGWVLGNFNDLLAGDFGFGTNDPAYVDTDGNTVFPVHERGTIDEVVFWDGTTVSSTRIAAHAAAALYGWEGDDTGSRVDRFLDLIGWPSALRDIADGASTLGPAGWSTGTSALSVLQAWADTEAGAFFIGPDGTLVWRSRHYPLLDPNAVTSQATFGDGHGGETLVYVADSFSPDRDETLIRNPVLASRKNGVTAQAKDQTLIDDEYGDRTWSSPTTEDANDATVRDRAGWFLEKFKDLKTRVASMKVRPQRDPANLYPQVLGRELGDHITVNRKPLNSGATNTYEQIIERIEHTFTPALWETEWRCSPTDPNVGNYLILDDATYGILDQQMIGY